MSALTNLKFNIVAITHETRKRKPIKECTYNTYSFIKYIKRGLDI